METALRKVRSGSVIRWRELLAGAAKPAFAAAIGINRFDETLATEIRPQRFSEMKFRIRQLPKEKIADAFFAAGANKKIRLGCVRHGEMLRQFLFVYIVKL